MPNIFVNQSDLIINMETGANITGGAAKILCLDPAGNKRQWTASISGTKVVYNCIPGDFNMQGVWQLQAFVVIGGLQAFGQIVSLTVVESLM